MHSALGSIAAALCTPPAHVPAADVVQRSPCSPLFRSMSADAEARRGVAHPSRTAQLQTAAEQGTCEGAAEQATTGLTLNQATQTGHLKRATLSLVEIEHSTTCATCAHLWARQGRDLPHMGCASSLAWAQPGRLTSSSALPHAITDRPALTLTSRGRESRARAWPLTCRIRACPGLKASAANCDQYCACGRLAGGVASATPQCTSVRVTLQQQDAPQYLARWASAQGRASSCTLARAG